MAASIGERSRAMLDGDNGRGGKDDRAALVV
jgi:hypothetical protein